MWSGWWCVSTTAGQSAAGASVASSAANRRSCSAGSVGAGVDQVSRVACRRGRRWCACWAAVRRSAQRQHVARRREPDRRHCSRGQVVEQRPQAHGQLRDGPAAQRFEQRHGRRRRAAARRVPRHPGRLLPSTNRRRPVLPARPRRPVQAAAWRRRSGVEAHRREGGRDERAGRHEVIGPNVESMSGEQIAESEPAAEQFAGEG